MSINGLELGNRNTHGGGIIANVRSEVTTLKNSPSKEKRDQYLKDTMVVSKMVRDYKNKKKGKQFPVRKTMIPLLKL